MLDMTQTVTPPSDWRAHLQPGDIVLLRFPCAEPDPTEQLKRRTCLVIDIEDLGGRRFAVIAYGTTAATSANIGDEIPVSTPEEIAHAGIHRPTRFVRGRRITVPLDHPGWDLNPRHPSPVLGRLLPKAMTRLNAIRRQKRSSLSCLRQRPSPDRRRRWPRISISSRWALSRWARCYVFAVPAEARS